MKFYETILKEVKPEDVLKTVYPERIAIQLTLEERLPEGKCTDCGKDEWIILPKESSMVSQGGKPYIECINCGHVTHL